MATLGQRWRLVFLLVYIIILSLTSHYALGSWLPPASEKGIWFHSGLASFLLGNLLVTPFFTKPVDSISYARFPHVPFRWCSHAISGINV